MSNHPLPRDRKECSGCIHKAECILEPFQCNKSMVPRRKFVQIKCPRCTFFRGIKTEEKVVCIQCGMQVDEYSYKGKHVLAPKSPGEDLSSYGDRRYDYE